MLRKKDGPPITRVEQELMDALGRLQEGKPQNAGLVRKAKLGTLKINASTVSTEAGRSRTLIGHDKCQYPRVRAAILALQHPIMEPRSAEDVIRRLREENVLLRKKIRARDTENAKLILQLRESIGSRVR